MNELIKALESVEHSVKSGNDPAKAQKAIESAIAATASWRSEHSKQLSEELSVWRAKLPVLWKEPAGRQGMAKHARHWIGKIA